MSETIDANVLVYASDRSSRYNADASQFLEHRAQLPDLLYVFWPTAMSYLRIATHPAIFEAPLAPETALRNLDSLIALPQVRVAGEPDRFWGVYRNVVANVVVRGNLVPDAHLVALMRIHGVRTIWTHDSDFRKFDGIDVRDPFD